MPASVLQPQRPANHHQRADWSQLAGSSAALALAKAATAHNGPMLVLADNEQHAWQLEAELKFFNQNLDILHFPDWETLPYDVFSPAQDIVSERLAALWHIPNLKRGIVLATLSTAMQRIAPTSYLAGHALLLDVGETLNLDALRSRLENAGYVCVPQVHEHGEFAVRGEIIDIFPMGTNQPYRIDLFDDEVESIRLFDPETQLSKDKVEQIRLLPAREFPLDKDGVANFRSRYRERIEGDPRRSPIYADISAGTTPGGIEYYLPLFFEQTGTLFDYLPEGTLLARWQNSPQRIDENWAQIQERYEQQCLDPDRPILPAKEIFIHPDELGQQLNQYQQIRLHNAEANTGDSFACQPPPELRIDARADEPAATLTQWIHGYAGRVLLVAESNGRRETLLEQLALSQLKAPSLDNWADFLSGDQPVAVTVAPIEQGCLLAEPSIAVIAETQLYGARVHQRKRRKASRDPATIIRDLADLQTGAPVVHETHGIGRYQGLTTLDVGGMTAEFLELVYAEDTKLYVPVSSLHLISRYTGAAAESAPLHKLGTDRWSKAKRRAQEKIRDVAAELLEIHAKRANAKGFAFTASEHDYQAFCEAFPFDETPDQATTIAAVLADMQSKRPMDRVVCGDVGFGKTEVAMRAAFAAVQSHKQVAVLVPTTLLAQQHARNFEDRFADWPVKVALVSRFGGAKAQKLALEGVADGTVDIVVGTHKLLSETMKFKDLGLIIVDEEHRFGVRHKEKLKALRASVDLLTMTATPIPRTLNMSLAGMRDLSIIATPPAERLAVKTFIGEWSDTRIKEACFRELKRGGQIYFLHNKVETIEKAVTDLQALLPDAKVQFAHGQMREQELEQVMLDFYHRRFNVLVATTIIESGIDVPNANTIIINRADHFGLAQLHQLRGRVGRSHHRAYAYMIVPPKKLMTADARKRIDALETLDELGSGFMLATHDMEIRGAGELLGEGQSGQITEIGFSLYSDLLERAVKALKSGKELSVDPESARTEIDLHIPALLPDDYLPDVHQRLVLYKRIASAPDTDALRELQVEIIDRFGLLPDATKNLFKVTELKLKAEPLGIRKIEAGAGSGRVTFMAEASIDPMNLIKLVQGQPDRYQLDGPEKLRFTRTMETAADRVDAINGLLHSLSRKQ